MDRDFYLSMLLKIFLFFIAFFCVFNYLSAFEKLPSQYLVAYGNPQAPIQVTEYFSLSCAKCIENFRKDFKALKERYIDTQKAYWVFHLNPADLLTLQAMVCLENLSLEEKKIFWEVVLDTLENPSDGCLIMQIAMETMGKPLSQLKDPSYLQMTSSFKNAYHYLKQPGLVTELPTVEINGKIYDAFPHRQFVEKQLSSLLTHRTQP